MRRGPRILANDASGEQAALENGERICGSSIDKKAEGRGTQKPDPLPFSPLQREPLFRHAKSPSRFGARWQGAEPGSRVYRHVSTSKSCLFQIDRAF